MKNAIGGFVIVVMAGLMAADVSAGSSAAVSIEDFKFTPAY